MDEVCESPSSVEKVDQNGVSSEESPDVEPTKNIIKVVAEVHATEEDYDDLEILQSVQDMSVDETDKTDSAMEIEESAKSSASKQFTDIKTDSIDKPGGNSSDCAKKLESSNGNMKSYKALEKLSDEIEVLDDETEAIDEEIESVEEETEAVEEETKAVDEETDAVDEGTEAVDAETEVVANETEAGEQVTKAVDIDIKADDKDTKDDDPVENDVKTDASPEVTNSKPEEGSTVDKDVTLEEEAKEPAEGKKKSKKDKKKGKTCAECGEKKPVQFRLHYQEQTHKLCSDECYQKFKLKTQKIAEADEKCGLCMKNSSHFNGRAFYPVIGNIKPLCSETCIKKYHEKNEPKKNCSECKKAMDRSPKLLSWETMQFCNEGCLGRYQTLLGSHCTCCQTPVLQSSMGKYCVCFGADIRQFCSGNCLHEFKKGLKVCTFCQTDLSTISDGFLAPVGDKGQFKDFCSPQCMEQFEILNNMSKNVPPQMDCSFCKKPGKYRTQVKYQNTTHYFCSDNCIAGFRWSNKIKDSVCHSCYKIFPSNSIDCLTLNLDGSLKSFCVKSCMTLYVLSHRKITQCASCKVKKYNFDMIEMVDSQGQTQLMCSLNCLTLFKSSSTASSGQNSSLPCASCGKAQQAQYHLTLSDSTTRGFCGYNCVLTFQNQLNNSTPVNNVSTPAAKPFNNQATMPVIADVKSLNTQSKTSTPTLSKTLISHTLTPGSTLAVLSPKMNSTNIIPLSSGPKPNREAVVKPRAPRSMKNKRLEVKPVCMTKSVDAVPKVCHKAVQTDDNPRPIILPIPVPIFIPTPFHMFSRPIPTALPFPVPVPVPIILPATSEDVAKAISENLAKLKEKAAEKEAQSLEEVEAAAQEAEDVVDTNSNEAEDIDTNEDNNGESAKNVSAQEDAEEMPSNKRKADEMSDDDIQEIFKDVEIKKGKFDDSVEIICLDDEIEIS